MSARIDWQCKRCLKRVNRFPAALELRLADHHECRSADLIRRAAAHYLDSGRPEDQKVSEWLDSCAVDAEGVGTPEDFDYCSEPGSVRRALAVAIALYGGADAEPTASGEMTEAERHRFYSELTGAGALRFVRLVLAHHPAVYDEAAARIKAEGGAR